MVNTINGFVRDREHAEDIADRAFQIAWEKRESFRGEAAPYTWLHAIARNEMRHSWRRDRLAQFDSIDREDAREFAGPEKVTDELEKREDRIRLQYALRQLPTKYRRALVAHFIEDQSIRVIARHERVPVGTVLSRIHKGKERLRKAWDASITSWHAEMTDEMPSRKSSQTVASQEIRLTRDQHPEPPAKTWDR